MSLQDLEESIERDFAKINYPPKPWRFEDEGVFDVAIIGAGLAGLTVAFALLRRGISKIQLFDENPTGKEGPWITYARMVTLRSPKQWMGPALGIPNLTFQSWFEAKYSHEEWDTFKKISKEQWMEYLVWYRKVLKLPVQNQAKLLSIIPQKGPLQLHLTKGNVLTHKVILATGRSGYGGPEIPQWIQKVPKSQWAHTNESIDFKELKGKNVAILGGGDSGFDAARFALDHGAKRADLFIRRTHLPNTNPGRELFYLGCYLGYYSLSDREKWNIFSHIAKKGTTPPRETLERISQYPNFHFHAHVDLETVLGKHDFYILATGLAVDGTKQPELKPHMDSILLWKDRGFLDPPKMSRFPYLGPHFEFLEKERGNAPYLKDIYCFNYGSFLSHSSLGVEIPPISYGAERLADGIAADFFLKDREKHYEKFENYDEPEFRAQEFSFFLGI